ncbi:7-deoxyloganetic acid glucosyltransferase-like [Phoenix dactylifera]|uniref:Glycosyltransferase n=1 Tax=Phoenix dactylifera TaxID=42345 RepID=A0A8B7BUA4_PHODC|nr:7-deoxyloganetic acid glucosyltransferase-like [Phoenix dactylifera]
MDGGRRKEVHVLVFPFPGQGMVNCMLKLADLLSGAGLLVTFLNTHHNHRHLSRFSGAHTRLAQRPKFRFASIPDGLSEEETRSVFNFFDLEESMRTRAAASFRDLLIAYRDKDSGGWPPVTCVIADGLMPFAVDVSEEVGIPAIIFRTISACCVWAFLCVPKLLENGEIPFPEGADLDEPVRGVPGMESFLRRRDLPSFCRQARDHTDRELQVVSSVTASANRARALILNTFESLEGSALSHIRNNSPVTYAVGPLNALARTSSDSGSLWQEDRDCMTWLDSQPDRSVVYVSFGSLAVVTREEFMEFWHGLVDSGQRFLWVVRSDLINRRGGGTEVLPAEVEEGTRERGCMVGWAPQEEVLSHPAVGCFLTHSGWNSTLESIAAGKPMLCWPFFADQQINSRFVSAVWGIGLDMKDLCGRSIVEKMVREVMEGERSEELRRNAREMAEMAKKSVAEGGTSFNEFQSLIRLIMSLDSHAPAC